MSRRRHDDDHEEHENHERWLVSYADMMTLLFALFVVLYAISSLNKSKIEAFASSMTKNKAIGQPMITTPEPVIDPVKPTPGNPITRAELEKLKQQLQDALNKAGLAKGANLEIDSKGLEVSLTDGVLYKPGDADLLPNGIKILQVIGPRLTSFDNPVLVEGHTDNTPIHTVAFPDNWALSSARANSVVRYLLYKDKVDADRLTSSGFADTRPIEKNDTAEHKAENRRVVVLISAPTSSGSTSSSTQTATAAATTTTTTSSSTSAASSGH